MIKPIEHFSSYLIQADLLFDKIPFGSSVTNLMDLFQKCIFIPLLNEKTKSHYYSYLESKASTRCFILLVPFLGNIIVWILDLYKNGTNNYSITFNSSLDVYNNRISKKTIKTKIAEHFKTHSLHPYVSAPWSTSKGVFQCDAFIEPCLNNRTNEISFIGGHFPLIPGRPKAMFCFIKNLSDNSFTTKLLFTTNRDLISPPLFYDIFLGPQLSIAAPTVPELYKSNQDTQLHIHSEPQKAGKINQRWTFFTQSKSVDAEVRLQKDGIGGTNFSLIMPK